VCSLVYGGSKPVLTGGEGFLIPGKFQCGERRRALLIASNVWTGSNEPSRDRWSRARPFLLPTRLPQTIQESSKSVLTRVAPPCPRSRSCIQHAIAALGSWWRSGYACIAAVLTTRGRCRENLTHIRQPRPDAGPGFQAKVLNTFEGAPSSLGSG